MNILNQTDQQKETWATLSTQENTKYATQALNFTAKF